MSTATASSATRVLALDPFACLASSEVLLHLLLKGCYLCCKCPPPLLGGFHYPSNPGRRLGTIPPS